MELLDSKHFWALILIYFSLTSLVSGFYFPLISQITGDISMWGL